LGAAAELGVGVTDDPAVDVGVEHDEEPPEHPRDVARQVPNLDQLESNEGTEIQSRGPGDWGFGMWEWVEQDR